jgi:ubiquinone/menaquinone biosynthesis C-methylase UbiE
MKDRFSQQAESYQKYRPSYPEELYAFLMSHVSEKEVAWDCGTGNGQVAVKLAQYFKKVYATDISENQLKQAPSLSNIIYKVERAEQTSFPDHHFDLITVAQAIHWFDFSLFYQEVQRTLKPGGVLAVIGYGLLKTEDPIQRIILHFYTHSIGSYWDKERMYIDELYQTIPFPLKETTAPLFYNTVEWTLSELIGYLNTWSAVKLYEKKEGVNPLSFIEKDLQKNWGTENNTKKFTFPVILRIGTL